MDAWYRARADKLPRVSWVVGPNEVANMVSMFASAIPGSMTAVIVRHPFYAGPFDVQPPERLSWLSAIWWRWVALPATFVRFANSAAGFIYLSQNGYLLNLRDGREFEMRFLKKHGVKIVHVFTGSDIRSPVLMQAHEDASGLPNIASYLKYTDAAFRDPGFDEERRRTGEIANRYADVIFTYRVDQKGYIDRPSKPFPYMVADAQFATNLDKFDHVTLPVLLHAPSSPIIKGTQLVRAAIAALREEGFEFEYIEVTGVPHEQVLEHLSRAHIVLNEFYSHAPGVFAVEAMAAGCVVLTSADENIEPDLPRRSNEAWVVTKHWQVYDHLKGLLQNPDRLEAQAKRGQRWAREHASVSVVAPKLGELFEELARGVCVE